MTQLAQPTASYNVQDVLAEMDELGRAKWEAATARVEARLVREELTRVLNERNAPADGPPPAGEPEPVAP